MSGVINNFRFNFLYIDKYTFGKNWVFPESVVPYNMLRFIENGDGTFFIDDKELQAGENKIVYIPRGSRLSCYASTESFSFISIRFTNSVSFEGGDFLSDYYQIPNVMEAENEKEYFEKIYYWVKGEDVAKMFFVRGYMELLIGTLISRVWENSDSLPQFPEFDDSFNLERIINIRKANTGIDARIQGVVDYILLHPTEKYTPEKMADMAELSKQRFSALFKEQTGKPPMTYVRELKLTAAARKILVTNDSVNDIAYSVGYEDPNYFIREFKAAFGYTPKRYRQVAKE